ncbi:MAG: hypothetical protein WBB82_02955 [Limnothrix sp.]
MAFSVQRFFILLCIALAGFWVVADRYPDSGWEYLVSFAFLASILFVCFETDEDDS